MSNSEMLEEYEINPLTMAVLPIQYGNKLYSQIYQLDGEFFSPLKPLALIKKGVLLYGTDYEGLKKGSRELIGSKHKIPIKIDAINSMYFFPTASPKTSPCAWISHEHVLYYEKYDSSNTFVMFNNKQSIKLPVSRHIFHNQMVNTAELRVKLMQRIDKYRREPALLYHRHSNA